MFSYLEDNVRDHLVNIIQELNKHIYHHKNNLIIRQYSDVSLDDESLFQHLNDRASMSNVNLAMDVDTMENNENFLVQVFFDRSRRIVFNGHKSNDSAYHFTGDE